MWKLKYELNLRSPTRPRVRKSYCAGLEYSETTEVAIEFN